MGEDPKSSHMLPPIILCLFMGMLAITCLVVAVWYAVAWISGAGTWDDASFPLILAQLGALFFGLFALAARAQHKGEEAGGGFILTLVLGFMLELAGLCSYACWHCYAESNELATCGVEVQGRIIDFEFTGEDGTATRYGRSSRSRAGHDGVVMYVYEFRTPDGVTHQGKTRDYSLRSYPFFRTLEERLAEMKAKLGSAVPVLYLPKNPQRSNINGYGYLWALPVALGCISGVFVLALLFVLYRIGRKPTRKLRFGRRRR